MTNDSPISSRSGAATPEGLDAHSTTSDATYLNADTFETSRANKAYLAGSKALDSLSRMIISTESFFHPSNSGPWTTDLTAFIKYLTAEFNKREASSIDACSIIYTLMHDFAGWYEERKPDCKTPQASQAALVLMAVVDQILS